jgi:hypothetical protein
MTVGLSETAGERPGRAAQIEHFALWVRCLLSVPRGGMRRIGLRFESWSDGVVFRKPGSNLTENGDWVC